MLGKLGGRLRFGFGRSAHGPWLGRPIAAGALGLEDKGPYGDHRGQHRQQLRLAEAQGERRVLAVELYEESPQRVHAEIGPEQHAVAWQAWLPVRPQATVRLADDATREPHQSGEN